MHFLNRKTTHLYVLPKTSASGKILFLYRAQLDGGVLFVEKNKLTYSFYDKDTYRKQHENPKNNSINKIKQTAFQVSFVNANVGAEVHSENPANDYNNYFIGNDRSKWASNVKSYQKLYIQIYGRK